jgi:hypothetical protein
MQMDGPKSDQASFVRGNARLDRLLACPEIAAGVAEVEAEARQSDRGSMPRTSPRSVGPVT